MKGIVSDFIKEHHVFLNIPIVRGLYLRIGSTEFFVLEQKEWKNQRKTFVFEFDCGHFVSCQTETNTMEKFMMDIPEADYAEYVSYI